MRILHVITGLDVGGAEMMLIKLLERLSCDEFESTVISLSEGGRLRGRLEAMGIPVVSAGIRKGLPSPVSMYRLAKIAREFKPNLIQGWMYHGNLASHLAASSLGTRIPVLWNVRQSLYGFSGEKRLTAGIIRMCARLSRWPERILYNSRVSAGQHEAIGYNASRTRIIPNGFDCDKFRPDAGARQRLRNELAVEPTSQLVGLIARFHPMKDHETFFLAAEKLLAGNFDVHFVLAGKGMTRENLELETLLASRPRLAARVHLLGERSDTPFLNAGLDVATLSSAWGEGFPNVVGEAMACGAPCVVTNIGDSAEVVGDFGLVVPARDPAALARGIASLLDASPQQRYELGRAARRRVLENYSMDVVAGMYTELYRRVGIEGQLLPGA
ncbi:MAG: glycosyltransferase [Candidatus Sericytochromatia bacterium]|uniref:Glycosyltransferase n=1 Tax=Candidatus Tanganyikabacteria bacterium TaxID=2961651 RepID=A0A937X5D1_9BACT|nr:glycosyltransferase [Candidatus Tanganyikabacteria bacterium]